MQVYADLCKVVCGGGGGGGGGRGGGGETPCSCSK